MIELKLRSILKQVKSENPQKRFEALDKLFIYKQEEGLEIQVDVLKDFIKAAASPFPERIDNWDNPSFYLIDFVCDFPMPEITQNLIKHFDGLDLRAKERAIEFLLSTEDEEIFYFLEDKIIELMQMEELLLPTRELSSYPALIEGILEKTLDKLNSNHYKFMIYDLLLSVNALKLGYKKETVLPSLLEDYQIAKLEYLKFNHEYSTKFVYTAWKESYFFVRSRMRLFINLMEYYYTPEIGIELNEAMTFNDPLVKTEAILASIAKNLPYNEDTLRECAEHLESAEMTYWELHEKNLEHLYPIKEEKQPLLAKARLFSTIINLPEEEDGVIHYPEDIQILDKIDTENSYGQPVRFYLISFKEHGDVYVGWAGGFSLEAGDDTAFLWDGTYTDFIELASGTIDDHKQEFFRNREEEKLEHENTVYFESSPKLSMGAWFFLALLIAHWVREALDGFDGTIIPSLLFTVLGVSYALFEVFKNKKRKVLIVGQSLVIENGAKLQTLGLHEIKKVEFNKKHIFIYDKKNELACKFPLRWVRYEVFYAYMREHTAHLKERPFIQS